MVRFLVLVPVLLGLAALPARADCGANASDAEVTQCLAQDLRDSDKRINAVYQSLMGALDDAGKTALRDAQRAWLRNRDKACGLDNKESDRERWLQAILTDQEKTSGVEVKLNRDYRVSIEGSSDVRALIARGLIKVNLGDRPFEYALPDGYRPFAEK